ncbi:MAG: GNVR domain-containing protein, partial [Candidatus Delongbacteria bacterium]
EVRDKPIVTVLDSARTKYRPVEPKKRQVVITNTFLVFVLCVGLVFLKEKYYSKEVIRKLYEAIKG